ncbi:hypothetical protein [Brevundimonas sp.]|uniref:phage fiber-tail adaptor protein n=1 Tax=Brevundimonas sp. TaxID=1871086 RepID=UPI0028A0C663|nr:hypothetical protein [Brevundimonas sp.]
MSNKLQFEAEKDPKGVRYYSFNWEEWLAEGETIVADPLPVVAVVNPQNELEIDGIAVEGPRVKIRVKKGKVMSHPVSCTITTSSGQIHPITANLIVKPQ